MLDTKPFAGVLFCPKPMTAHPPIKLFQFPRMFGIPNVSPFCCKLETWLRIAGIPYEVVNTPDPRKGPKGKLPFIEDAGVRIADTSLIVDHLVKTRCVDPDARLDASQRAIALLVQRTLEEHYAFVLAYTHILRDEGWQYTRTRFDSVPVIVRPLAAGWCADASRRCSGSRVSCATRTRISSNRRCAIGARS